MSSRAYVPVLLSGQVGRTLACMRRVHPVSFRILPTRLPGTHCHPTRPHQFLIISLHLHNRTRVRAPHRTLSTLPPPHRVEAAAERLAQSQKHRRLSPSDHLYRGPRPTIHLLPVQLVDIYMFCCLLYSKWATCSARDHYPISTCHHASDELFRILFCIPFPPRMPNLCIINCWTVFFRGVFFFGLSPRGKGKGVFITRGMHKRPSLQGDKIRIDIEQIQTRQDQLYLLVSIGPGDDALLPPPTRYALRNTRMPFFSCATSLISAVNFAFCSSVRRYGVK